MLRKTMPTLWVRSVVNVLAAYMMIGYNVRNDAIFPDVVIMDPQKSQLILQDINSILEKPFKISHRTIQPPYHSKSNLIHVLKNLLHCVK
jgi:hypothetical protein